MLKGGSDASNEDLFASEPKTVEPGESAVGTMVDIRHLAATPLGQHVTAEAEVIEVGGRRIVFAVTARDEVEEIGRGTHERMMIDLRRVMQRLDAKAGRRSTAADAD